MKSSPAKAAANRANAKHSTGPQSAAGKEKTAQNARKHGFTGARFFCPESLRPLLSQIEEEYRAAINPKGFLEQDAFLQLRNARFNMERAQLLMDELGSRSDAAGLDPLSDPEACKQYMLYQRYFNQAQSAFHRYLRLLRQLQTERVLHERPDIAPYIPALANANAFLRSVKDYGRQSTHSAIEALNAFIDSPLPGQFPYDFDASQTEPNAA